MYAKTTVILKPVKEDRLLAALERLGRVSSAIAPPALEEPLEAEDHVLLRTGRRATFLEVRQIARIDAETPYSRVTSRDGRTALTPRTLRQWRERLPQRLFVQIHRSTLVNVDCIEHIERGPRSTYRVFLQNFEHPAAMSRRYARRLEERF